jgi:hypothetical protein
MDYGRGTTRDCASVTPLLSDYVQERLDEEARQAVRAHLPGCAACTDKAALLDPSILFMRMGQHSPKPEFWAGFDTSLRKRIEAEAKRPRRFWAGWDFKPATSYGMPRLAFAAPLAMLALLAGLVYVSQPGMILRGPRLQVEGIRPPNAPLSPTRPGAGRAAVEPAGNLRLASRLGAADDASLPTLEEVSSPAARVYRLDAGSAAGDSAGGIDAAAVYFVVDETINF